MTAIEEVEWESCHVELHRNPEVVRHLRSEFGFVPELGLYFSECPWVVQFMTAFRYEGGKLTELEFDLANRLSLAVSQENSCRYCFAATRLLMRVMGHSETQIRRLEQDILSSEVGDKERAGLDFARRLSRSNPLLTRDNLDPLLAVGFTIEEVREMAVVAASMCAFNRFVTFIALPPESLEAAPDRILIRWLAPIGSWFLRRRHLRGEPDTLSPEAEAGPYAYLVASLRGLPLARSVREVVDEAWASPLLGTRLKAFVMAVVARGLGTPLAEAEAIRLLEAEGLSRNSIDSTLAHLGSPTLDATESLVVPFARETIWYSPAAIQRRTREIQKHLSGPQFLELLGVVSLANMLCRLDFVSETAEH